MPDGLITNRPLQNESTGIDLHVPLYQEVRGSMITGHVEYQIVVVTRLAAFKSAKHKPGDVVQFVVSKKYSELDEFYHSLMTRYPSITLPSMPRKALFVGETDLRERRVAFDELVKFISKHPMLANCSELLEFLGAKTTLSDFKTTNKPEKEEEDCLDFFGRDEPSSFVSVSHTKSVKPPQPHEEEELFDPLGSERYKKHRNTRNVSPVAKSDTIPKPKTLFDEEDDPDKGLFTPEVKADMRLFEDPHFGRTDILMCSNASNNSIQSTDSKMDEDIDELFRVEVDLDKLLTVSKTAKRRPDIALKPKPEVKGKSSPVTHTTGLQQSRAEAMDQMDILQYIQQNEMPASEDLDLF
ncbi:HCLS1-binding protein 3 isoform X1 [Myxocyprinus asiaticus]|uniref:HCLS1-binding protein 3 isoform X1 n=1 Tax=Myxocyprinus asiaticus TaxID=70543 RepID=UPI002222A0F9|nr:HCLS1-binding protein 3 isoform X1 [Myxocyprinus asiaticus]